jgi:hypothetical protein
MLTTETLKAASRLAVFGLIAATGTDNEGRALCAALLDGAVEVLQTAPPATLAAVAGGRATVDRLAALAVLAEACATCAACPRGAPVNATSPGAETPDRSRADPPARRANAAGTNRPRKPRRGVPTWS